MRDAGYGIRDPLKTGNWKLEAGNWHAGSQYMQIRTVGVLGCGLMGAGIAQVSAAAGYRTIVREVEDSLVSKGLGRIERFLAGGVEKGKLTADDKAKTLANLSGTARLEDLKGCDIIIEAIIENIDEKASSYATLDSVLPEHAVLCSNTSSLCITELAARTKRPDRFAGLHFFNPVPLMKLVEVVRGLATSDATYQSVFAFAQTLGKEPVTAPDRPGFIVNRLLVPYLLDAIRAYEHGLGTVEDIDKGMKLGCGYPMGPFTLLDFVGLDTTYYIANIMFDEYREPAYAPPPLLKRMVLAGRLGRKSGEGFYKY
jgi:3-hydroxybutyryl-CoA dehydrogenase